VGEFFIQDENQWNKEAVIGDTVARKLGLRLNDKFNPYHGLNFAPNQKPHKDEYIVTGILKPTGAPADRVIWIPIEGLQQMDGHDSKYSGDVSAVLIQMSEDPTARGFGMNSLDSIYNKGTDHLTFVKSTDEVVTRLFEQFAWAEIVLRWVAYLVAVVAAGGVLASIYNSMNERRREFAILRALGASRGTIFSIIVLESAVIAAIGAVIGFGIYAVIMVAAESTLRDEIGVTLHLQEFHNIMVIVPLGLVALGAAVGIVPAFKAYSTDVAQNLIPQS
jgi:putative ABC transport system permease protein